MQELFAKRVQILQLLLRKKGANVSYYSRKALSQIRRMPYHMLKPHDERQPISQSRLLRNKRAIAQSNVDITQKSLMMQAHLSLAQRSLVLNSENPYAAWNRHSLSKEYRRRGIQYKKVRPRYGFRKVSQATLLVKDQLLMDELKRTLSGRASGRDEVIFIDEVIFSMKMFKPYAWSHTAQSIT